MIIRKSVLDLPIERQKELAELAGYSSFEEWRKKTQKSVEESYARFEQEEEEFYTREEAEELIADIINNPEDKVGFAQRMAFDPDSVTAEKMIASIRSRIRD